MTTPLEITRSPAPETTTAPTLAESPTVPPGPVVLIADKFESSGIELLEQAGCRVQNEPDVSAEHLAEALSRIDPEVLIVRSTKVPKPALTAANSLGLIVRAGAGYDNIDVETASARGVFVANCPGKNAIAVAELAWGLILACDRRIPDQVAATRAGSWDKKGFAGAPGLYGQTLGIVGLGRIGLEVARRAKSFGMSVVAWSRSLTEEKADELEVGYCSSVINLAKMCDVVSLHIAATDETKNFIDESFINAMKDGAILINTSRGSILDQLALAEGVKTKHLRVGLDVYAQQPAPSDKEFKDPIVQIPGVVYGTHHNGASTQQAQRAIADETVRIIQHYAATGDILHCVNRAAASPATSLLTVRHLNQPGVLAHIFKIIGTDSLINVEEMENIIYLGAKAACARIHLNGPLDEAALLKIKENPNILSASQTPNYK